MSTSPVSGSHSQASLSPGNSQTRSTTDDIPLETLVTHLLASKRSLSSINTVWRANEIVTSARSALEESVILGSRTGFLRKGISQQAKILRKVRGGVEAVYKDGQRDFQNVIRSLDAADIRLQKTMAVLRSTIVEAAFRPTDERPRTLLDFVDEAGVETMRTALKDSIDQSQDAQAEFHESIQSFETDLKNIRSAMTSSNSPPSQSLDSPIPPHLRSLESHASEMAALLDSLVQHFDVCVNAIKHTEGGFAAVKQAASNNQLPDGVTVSGVIPPNANDGTDSGNLEPISEDERRELLTVLANDAAEVEDVVQELHHRLASMEEQHEAILDHVASLNSSYTSTTKAFTLLEAVGSRLPSYIVASSDFQVRWGELKSLIGEQMEELESMRVFYEGYMASYDGLIGEVARRNQDEERMKSVLRKAMEQVRKIHDADSRAREGFRKDVGEFLPSDLWPGLVADAPKYEVGVVGEEEDESSSTPELDKQVVEAAAKREKERQK